MTERIEITNSEPADNTDWSPYEGEEINDLLKHKEFTDASGNLNESGQRIIEETFRIMEMCGGPQAETNHDTGLVLGYVQSGKTLSFTSLAALANDNQYQIVIVIAGTSKPLSDQNYDRLISDLRYEKRYDRKWIIIKNPDKKDKDDISLKLEQWADATLPNEECSTILLTVMKNGNRLRNLTDLVKKLDLNGVPTLIIDDEGDQASLNTLARRNAREEASIDEGEVSTIYRRISELRRAFPHHTFLQYTASPQGNLFINIMDRLSPNFIKLLTPGDDYTGGKTFFMERTDLVRAIPEEEIPTNNNVVAEPPQSLLYALKLFFMGVLIGKQNRKQRNRSMLIHPSRLTHAHKTYLRWVKDACNSWVRLLESSDEEDKQVLLSEFEKAYLDLQETEEGLLDFSQLPLTRLIHEIKYTRIIEVNARSGPTPGIRWNDNYSHILVGGQAMDRGFTVEGLTVTYMPRNLGTGQVDTTLQRARFFGYKGSYLGFCRVWLDQSTIDAYKAIVEHEEDVRSRLEEFDVNNKHLNDWDREVVLNRILRLTRPNILFNTVDRDAIKDWFRIRAPHDTDHLIPANRNVVQQFTTQQAHALQPDPGDHRRTEEQRHMQVEIPLKTALENLLNKLKFTRESDSQTYSSIRNVLAAQAEKHPEETCVVYWMSSHVKGGLFEQHTRKRRLNDKDQIDQLFQGRNAGTGYPGDSKIREENKVCIQLHRLHLLDENGQSIKDEEDNVLYDDVLGLAVWIAPALATHIVRQPDNR